MKELTLIRNGKSQIFFEITWDKIRDIFANQDETEIIYTKGSVLEYKIVGTHYFFRLDGNLEKRLHETFKLVKTKQVDNKIYYIIKR